MGKYILRRLSVSVPAFLGITVLVFFLSYMAPGSPVDILFANPDMAYTIDTGDIESRLGLDLPVHVQYFNWIRNILKGNMGTSFRTGLPVSGMIAERVGPTLMLTCSSVVLAVLIAIPLGVMSAYKPYSLWDYLSSGLSFLGAATPNFFAGLVFIYVLSVRLKLLPSSGMYDSSGLYLLPDLLRHMVLPTIVLAIHQTGSLIRQTRGSVLEALQDDYIRTARSKGCSEARILFRHALRNSLAPVVTKLGSMIPFLVGGAVVTEQLFSWPGLGSLMVSSINNRDYPVIMGITVVIAFAVLAGNLLIDLLYSLLDPRIRYSK